MCLDRNAEFGIYLPSSASLVGPGSHLGDMQHPCCWRNVTFESAHELSSQLALSWLCRSGCQAARKELLSAEFCCRPWSTGGLKLLIINSVRFKQKSTPTSNCFVTNFCVCARMRVCAYVCVYVFYGNACECMHTCISLQRT